MRLEEGQGLRLALAKTKRIGSKSKKSGSGENIKYFHHLLPGKIESNEILCQRPLHLASIERYPPIGEIYKFAKKNAEIKTFE